MDISGISLTAFISCQAINTAALIVDYAIIKAGLPSISEIAHAYPLVGGIIVSFELLPPVFIGMHFYYLPTTRI